MRRFYVALILLATGCGGGQSGSPTATADGLAETKLDGHSVTRTVTDDAEATDYLSPDTVKLGVVDAAHVIGEPVTFTVYQYADTAAAEAAMSAWRADVDDGLMGDFPVAQAVTVKGPASALDGITDDSLVIDVQPVIHVVARKGAFIVRAIGGEAAAIEAAKTILQDA